MALLQLRKANHIAIGTDDIDALLTFYTNILGFERVDRPFDGMFDGYWLRLGNNGMMMHIIGSNAYQQLLDLNPRMRPLPGGLTNMKLPQREIDIRRAMQDHFSFEVENLEGAMDFLSSHGIKYQVNNKRNVTQLWFEDPDGRTIELMPIDENPPAKL